jgi:competence protein ComEC
VNANSIISLISVDKENYLFMGDATKETEKYLMDNIYKKEANKRIEILNKLNNLYVLQIGHHGSKTSTSDYFLSNIKTKNSVISSKKQVYGHPAKETLDILKKYNIRYYITEYKGALKF